MPLLDVDNLSVVYAHGDERIVAVNHVSLTIEPGEIVALVGESGSGKSSVALAITKLLASPPAFVTARHILFEGANVLDLPEQALRSLRGGKISYVFQDPAASLNPVLTIGEQLREVLELHADVRGREAAVRAIEWLRRVGIPSEQCRLGAYPHEFSGGMQQRVMIAMAIACGPKLLIADEPTTALDVTVQVQILRLLRDVQQRLGLAMLLISHDLLVVERIAHRVAVMSKGCIVELGPVKQLFQQPTHPYTKYLLSCRQAVSLHKVTDSHA